MYATIYRLCRGLWPPERAMRRCWRELEQTQWLDPAELAAWQWTRLKALLSHAYNNVPYYRRRYQALDIHPDDIKTWHDFEALPFLTKEDVNTHRDDLIATNFKGKLYPNQTGGSTGEPMRFFHEASFWHWNVTLWRGRAWHGVRAGDKIAWIWGAQADMPAWTWQNRLKAAIMRQRYLNAFSMTEAKMKNFADMLTRWRPKMIRVYPSTLEIFARYLKAQNITGIRPRLIEATAEKVTPPQRELFQEVFAAPVADVYSARELATITYPCPHGSNHVVEPRYLEIIANGRPVSPGQMGEVVITSLHQYAMPFIRYKMGDLARLQAEPCGCGRGLPVLSEVVGRTHDYLVTADGQFVHGEFFAYTFRVKPEVTRFQVYQPDKTHLEIRLVCRQAVDAAWLEAVKAEIQARFGPRMNISLALVDSIELTPAGKHRFIISNVKPDFI